MRRPGYLAVPSPRHGMFVTDETDCLGARVGQFVPCAWVALRRNSGQSSRLSWRLDIRAFRRCLADLMRRAGVTFVMTMAVKFNISGVGPRMLTSPWRNSRPLPRDELIRRCRR